MPQPNTVLHRAEIDGVPVVWVEGAPDHLEASLVFRVGGRDESFTTNGITHLVEHLAMRVASRPRLDANASVSTLVTVFEVSGSPDTVVRFLREVCEALTTLPVDALEIEKKVLRAEDGSSVPGIVGDDLTQRFGARSIGLAGWCPVALDTITAEQVRAHAAHYFVRQNAALSFVGEPPAGITLPLGDGTAAPVPGDRPVRATPFWRTLGDRGVTVSFIAPTDDPAKDVALRAVSRIATDRATEQIRHQRGWAYEVDFSQVTLRPDSVPAMLTSFCCDSPAEHAADAAQHLLAILRDLRDVGPTDEELALDLAAYREHRSDPRTLPSFAEGAAIDVVLGASIVDPNEYLALSAGLSTAGCRAVLANLEASLVVGLPEGVEPGEWNVSWTAPSEGVPVRGEAFGRSIGGLRRHVPRGSRLIVGDEGVTLAVPGDGVTTIRWDQLVGVADEGPDPITLFDEAGQDLPLSRTWFKNAGRAWELIDRAIDPALRFPLADD